MTINCDTAFAILAMFVIMTSIISPVNITSTLDISQIVAFSGTSLVEEDNFENNPIM